VLPGLAAAAFRDAAAGLGLCGSAPATWLQGEDSAGIEAAIAARLAARAAKDWAEADRIRDALKAQGIVIEDSAKGTTWRRA
jgi:cysteinyl-tRNA synthetase